MRFRSYFPNDFGIFQFLMLGVILVAAACAVMIMGP
jgi:hypothetical protein